MANATRSSDYLFELKGCTFKKVLTLRNVFTCQIMIMSLEGCLQCIMMD